VKIISEGEEKLKKYEFSFKAQPNEILLSKERVLSVLDKHYLDIDPSDLHYTCESTGPYHRPLTLIWSAKPTVVNPLLATPSRRKTDVLDAQLLAHYDITGLFPTSFLPPEEITEVRNLFNEYRRASKYCTQSTNRINNVMTYYGNTIGSMGRVTLSSIRPFIEDFIDGKDVKHEGLFKRPPKLVCEEIKNLYNEYDIKHNAKTEKLKCIIECIKACTFESLEGQKLSGKNLLKLLKTCPGIGDMTACLFICEIANCFRFPSHKSIVAYCGFDPSVKVSAGKVTSATVRRGNKELHASLMRAAGVLLNHKSEYFGQWASRIQKKSAKGGYRKACAAIGRKLIISMYYMWLRNEEFTYENYKRDEFCIDDIPLERTQLSKRTVTKLKNLGISSSGLLESKYKTAELFQKGIGGKTIEEIEICLKVMQQAKRAKLSAKTCE
jgi:transposase